MNTKRQRIQSLDLLKGLIMVIMALDHVRDYFHYDSFFFDPTDPAQTNSAIFLTRWITHYCAPAFSFLAGVSAFLVGRRKSKAELSSFLLKRGVWLIFIEFTVVNFAWFFDYQFDTIGFLVIYCLGVSMLFLAAIIHLQLKHILIFSLVVIFGHNGLDYLGVESSIGWSLIHEFGFFSLDNGKLLFVGYPIIPWIAVMSLGYYFGSFYDSSFSPEQRKRIFRIIGFTAVVAFVGIRLINGYGNNKFWVSQDTFGQTIFSFMDPSKYPPSLTYLLMTLGPIFIFLAYSEQLKGKLVEFFKVYGRVPFFYYILHLYFIHGLALLVAWGTGFGWEKMLVKGWVSASPELDGFGYDLWVVYVIWIVIVLALYPLCKRFSDYKKANKEKAWLSYL